MAVRFAHMADSHLGAFRDPVLRRLNLEAFLAALDAVEAEGAELLVIAGDLFDTNLPDLVTVDRATAGLRRLREAGVRTYVFYGSHDRSPTDKGIVDVLASAGLFENVGLGPGGGEGDGPPDMVEDGPTGTVLAAVAGRRRGLERGLLESLDREALGEASGGAPLAIFGYHGPVEGMMPPELAMLETVPADALPRGFDYYALGHVHHHQEARLPTGGLAAYPGPTFGATFADLADGREKGLLIVDADDGGRCEARHVPVRVAEVELLDLNLEGTSGEEGHQRLEEMAGGIDPEGRLVLLRVRGALSSGRPSDVGIPDVREDLLRRDALAVHVSRAGLRPPQRTGAGEGPAVSDPEAIFDMVVAGAVEGHASPLPWLRGGEGVGLARELYGVLRAARGEGKRADHERAVLEGAMRVLSGPQRLDGEVTATADEGGAGPVGDADRVTLDDWDGGDEG